MRSTSLIEGINTHYEICLVLVLLHLTVSHNIKTLFVTFYCRKQLFQSLVLEDDLALRWSYVTEFIFILQ